MHSHDKAHTGTTFIIRNDINHYEIDKFQKEFLQATSIMIEDWNSCITISTIYVLPKYSIKKEQYITFFKTSYITIYNLLKSFW